MRKHTHLEMRAPPSVQNKPNYWTTTQQYSAVRDMKI